MFLYDLGIFANGFRHIFKNDAEFGSFFFDLVIDIERVVLPSRACEVFAFGFWDAESFKFLFDFWVDVFSVACVAGIILMGLGVVDDIVEIKFF
jgi:hypothetical protein